MPPETDAIDQVMPILLNWLESCRRRNKISRNTVAVGLVILDHIGKKWPLELRDLTSRGGEITGSRAGLPALLERYGLGTRFLKEVTTRQGHQDGQRLFEMVKSAASLSGDQTQRKEQLSKAIQHLISLGLIWLNQRHIKVACDRSLAPGRWIGSILNEAQGRSGGKIEQHLVGAKLEQRFEEDGIEISNHAGNAGDVQTARSGDFTIASTTYHVTTAPGSSVIDKCASNISVGLHPVLIVPRESVERARLWAEEKGIDGRMTIAALDDFLALNVIEMAKGDNSDFFRTLQGIVERYNRRLEEVETDMSLRIEIE